MHPALQQHVGPPAIKTGRYVAAGALLGFAGVVLTLAIFAFVDQRSRDAYQEGIEARTTYRDDVDSRVATDPGPLTRLDASEQPARARAIAAATARAFAFEAFPSWVAAHPDLPCPSHLTELREYVPSASDLDPWGTAYRMECGTILAVVSAGPDRSFGTTDDVGSR